MPPAWEAAFARDAQHGKPPLADPLPERRLARLLGAFIAVGLFFLVVPGTLAGVWNLVSISSHKDAASVPAAWIQAHGHAQLLGWVGTFIIGISLYSAPKFRGAWIRSVPVGWAMLALWTAAILLRWIAGVEGWRNGIVYPLTAAVELLVGLLALWQLSAPGSSPLFRDVWNRWIGAGFLALCVALALQIAGHPQVLTLLVWGFCYPVVWGYSSRFLPSFLGLQPLDARRANIALAVWAIGLAVQSQPLLLASVALACSALRIFHPARQKAKTLFVHPHYPWFTRSAFAWLLVAAALALWDRTPGMLGASRHAFTVGFLAMMIFSIGPRLLPAFLNSRELWSARLMGVAMWLLTAGCSLRVTAQPVAYGDIAAAAWELLPVSAVIELTAVLLFAVNIGATLASRMPVWVNRNQIKDSMSLYWFVTAYPGTRRVLIDNGLRTLAEVDRVPMSLTLREAAEADGANPERVLAAVTSYLESRLARALRKAS
jgi:hypothetical protein